MSLLHSSKSPRQSGFTIVESLMAIIVGSILLTAIAPLIVLSVASRVQARRVDLATQAARGYIDGLRANVILPPSTNTADFSSSEGNLGVAALTAKPTDPGTCLDKQLNTLSATDCNDTNSFLLIQAFRDGPANGATIDSDETKAVVKRGYCLGVRVYRAEAIFKGDTSKLKLQPLKTLFTESAETKYYPLVVMKTEIINRTSLETYTSRFKNLDGTDKANPTSCN